MNADFQDIKEMEKIERKYIFSVIRENLRPNKLKGG
jgi:hypothetical protein